MLLKQSHGCQCQHQYPGTAKIAKVRAVRKMSIVTLRVPDGSRNSLGGVNFTAAAMERNLLKPVFHNS